MSLIVMLLVMLLKKYGTPEDVDRYRCLLRDEIEEHLEIIRLLRERDKLLQKMGQDKLQEKKENGINGIKRV